MAEPGTGEIRDGMRIDWDVPIEMDDGTVLRADVFRPPGDKRRTARGLLLRDEPVAGAALRAGRDLLEVTPVR